MYKLTAEDIEAIKQGEADIAAGRYYDWEDVKAEIDEMLRVAREEALKKKGSYRESRRCIPSITYDSYQAL